MAAICKFGGHFQLHSTSERYPSTSRLPMRRLSVSMAIAAAALTAVQVAGAASSSSNGDRWSGGYVGLNAGGNWGDDPVHTEATNISFCPAGTCGHAEATAQASIQGATGSFPVNTNGFVRGGQVGYGWQPGTHWVVGVEADLQSLSGVEGSKAGSAEYAVEGFAGHSVSTSLVVTKQIDYVGTLRGRLGYPVRPNLLIFGTAGAAYGRVKSTTHIAQQFVGAGLGGVATSFDGDSSASDTLLGWTAGAGLEWLFATNWSAKAEYLYYDLGKLSSDAQIADRITTPAPPTENYFLNNVHSTTRFNDSMVRVGVNYHF